MLQRVIAVVLAVLGLTTVGLAVASGTVWKPDSVVEARAESGDGTTLLITDPGVLGLVNDSVQITASRADGGKVALAIGRESHVLGWVGDDAHTVVTGMQTWETLSTSFIEGDTVAVENDSDEDGDDEDADSEAGDTDGSESPAPDASGLVGPNPAGSDMWLASAAEDEQAALTWEPAVQDDRLLLLVANSGDDAPPPVLDLTWEREVSTPLMIPGFIVGGVLVVIALLVFLSARRRTRAADRTKRSQEQIPASTDSPETPAAGSERADETPAIPATAPHTSTDAEADAELATTSGDADRDEASETETPARQTGMLQGSETSDVAGPTTPVVSRTPPVADDMPTQPMSRRELREMAEREAAEQTRSRKSGRVKRRRSQDSADQTEQDAGAANSAAAPTRSSRSTRSVRSTKSVRSTRSVWSSMSAATGSFPQVTTPGGTEHDEPTAQDHNRADAWRRAWGFQQGGDPQDSTAQDNTEQVVEKEDQE